MIDKRILIIGHVISSPRKAFQEIDSNGNYYFGAAIVILVLGGALTSLALDNLFVKFNMYPADPMFKVTNTVHSIAFEFLYVILAYYIGKRFDGVAKFRNILSTLSYSSIPGFIGYTILSLSAMSVVPKLPDDPMMTDLFLAIFPMMFISLPLGIWALVLNIFACSTSHKFRKKRAFGILIIAAIVLGIIGAIVELAIGRNLYA